MGLQQQVFYPAIGATELDSPDLVNVTPLKVKRQGIGYDIILTGTPGNRQVLYTAAEGKLTFLIAFELAEADVLIRGLGEGIYVLYK